MDGVEFVRHLARIGYAGSLVLVRRRILQATEKLAKAHALNVLGALHKPVSPDAGREAPSRCNGTPRCPQDSMSPTNCGEPSRAES